MSLNTFVDYYALLGVEPTAEPETIHRVFHILARRFHPDNPGGGNLERFLAVKEAYEVLSAEASRKAFDAERRKHVAEGDAPLPVFMTKEFTDEIQGESKRRLGLLCLLYNRRKQQPGRPSLSAREIESMMCIPQEHLTFTTWYLKQKRLIQSDDKSSMMITADGIDFLEASLPKEEVVRKLLAAPFDWENYQKQKSSETAA